MAENKQIRETQKNTKINGEEEVESSK